MAKRGRKDFEPISTSQGDPRVGDLTVGDYANGVPNIRLGEMFKSIAKQMIWVLPLALLGFIAVFYATKDLKRVYSGDGRIMVQLGEEYVYNPVGGAATGGGLMTTIDTITLTEAALMKNGKIIKTVIGRMTPDVASQNRFDKDAFAKINKKNISERDREDAIMEMRKSVESNFIVMPRPKSSIIDVQFRHEDPGMAVDVTRAFIEEYLILRRDVFVEGSSELISDRREATEAQLNANERSIARFLKRNNVADFQSEQTGLRKRTEDLKASLNATRASVAETEAALAETEDQLRGMPATIDLYRDDRAAQRVSQAELELRQLMAKYLPTSDPVRQKQTELNELRSLQQSYGGKASGGRRVGPNPTHQALTTQRNSLAANADSLREREFTQQRQLNSADGKIRKLTSLTPEYQNLLRERETLNVRLTSYNAKEQEALIDSAQAESQAENVTVIAWPEYANKGRNTRMVMLALGSMGWFIVLGFFALIRVFLDPKLYIDPNASRRPKEDIFAQEIAPEMAPPLHAPIPEPVPTYAPVEPPYANPYEPQPAAYEEQPAAYEQHAVGYSGTQPQPAAYAQPATYAQAGVAAGAVSGYSPITGYDPSAYVQYDSSGEVHPVLGSGTSYGVVSDPFNPNPIPAFNGTNAAVDMAHNPYLSGQVQAGTFNDHVQFDEYGRPLPTPTT